MYTSLSVKLTPAMLGHKFLTNYPPPPFFVFVNYMYITQMVYLHQVQWQQLSICVLSLNCYSAWTKPIATTLKLEYVVDNPELEKWTSETTTDMTKTY